MEQYILEYSKYITALFASLYAYECFAVFRYPTETERNGIYRCQSVLLFLTHFSCFLPVYVKNQKIEYVFLFVFQQLALYTVIVLYHMIYPKRNRLLVQNMCFLLSVGFVMLTRLSYDKAVRQFVITVISAVAALIVPELMRKFRRLRDFAWLYALLGITALGIVLMLGTVTNGSRLSFSVFGIRFQASELVKILFVFYTAAMLCRELSFLQIALSAAGAGVHVLILVLSKDLGSALIYFVAYVVMVYIASGKRRYLAAGFLGGSAFAFAAWKIFTHVQVRVQAWLDPWSVIDREGYQITQSLFAIGCGGLFGLGLCQGSPKSIPYVDTDFIFSAIAEELGILFALCLILVYLSCFVMIMRIASGMKDEFCRLTAAGLGVTYIFQVFLTIGGGIKFIPLTGVTLPFISYGGSSVFCTILMFSVIQGLYLVGGRKNVRRLKAENAVQKNKADKERAKKSEQNE